MLKLRRIKTIFLLTLLLSVFIWGCSSKTTRSQAIKKCTDFECLETSMKACSPADIAGEYGAIIYGFESDKCHYLSKNPANDYDCRILNDLLEKASQNLNLDDNSRDAYCISIEK